MPLPVIAAVGIALAAVSIYQGFRAAGKAKSAANAIASAEVREGQYTRQESDFKALKVMEDTRRLMGEQRAAFAGSGVVSDEGSPMDVIQDTAFKGQRDALWIQYVGKLTEAGFIDRAAATSELAHAQISAQRNANTIAAANSILTSAQLAL